jgi:calcineurin-like phosphoesterase family protein
MGDWVTSDQHYGHLRICELVGRPFPHGAAGIGEMNTELIRRFNERVQPGDRTWHAGDFAMGRIDSSLPLVGQLNGEHLLKPGNHDRCWPGYYTRGKAENAFFRAGPKVTEWSRKYIEAGFLEIHGFYLPALASHILTPAGEPALISHFPYAGGGDSQEEERYTDWRPVDEGRWLICGHVHDAWRQRGRMINVGVDAWGGYPVSSAQILELIEAGPRDLEPLPW